MTTRDNTFRVRDMRTRDHYRIDHDLFRQGYTRLIGPHGIALYNALCHFADYTTQDSYPALDTLAKVTGMSKPTAIKYLKVLVAAGLIYPVARSLPTGTDGNAINLSNEYYLLTVKPLADDLREALADVIASVKSGKLGTDGLTSLVKELYEGGKAALLGVVKEFYQGSKGALHKRCPVNDAQFNNAQYTADARAHEESDHPISHSDNGTAAAEFVEGDQDSFTAADTDTTSRNRNDNNHDTTTAPPPKVARKGSPAPFAPVLDQIDQHQEAQGQPTLKASQRNLITRWCGKQSKTPSDLEALWRNASSNSSLYNPLGFLLAMARRGKWEAPLHIVNRPDGLTEKMAPHDRDPSRYGDQERARMMYEINQQFLARQAKGA